MDRPQLRVINSDPISTPTSGGGGTGDGSMEARVAKLESHVEHIQSDIGEIKTDIREIRGDLKGIRQQISNQNLWMIGTVIAAVAGVAAIMSMMK